MRNPWKASLLLVLLAALPSQAQDNRLPQDEARRFAKLCVEQTTLTDPQIKTDVDPDKACAEKGEGGGAMVIPDKKLSKEVIGKAEKEIVPVGQLWLRKWTTVVKGKPTPKDKLRVMTVKIDDKDRPMPLLLLGIRQTGEKDLELVVYAKDSEPQQVLPLKKLDQIQALPVDLEWQRGEKNVDSLTITIMGQFQAVLSITRQAD